MACCRIVIVLFFSVCILVATTDVAKHTSAAATGGGVAGRWTELTAGSPARYSAAGPAGDDVFRGSERRIPKGPDPIHNRRAGKMTTAPRRRD
uniref:CLAVATA3/ESR-like protein n=1 Tax=Leersia perrieri TaxID=77586 RepID=A0A0D9WID0_9ORYZ